MVCGRSHLNVSALIKQVPNDVRVQVVAVRHKNDESNSAIRNFTNFTNRLDDVVCHNNKPKCVIKLGFLNISHRWL